MQRSKPSFRLSMIAAVMLPLAGCASISDAVSTPKTTPMNYPSAIVPSQQAVISSSDMSNNIRPAAPNSLWRNGARAFFHDQRAGRVGDILTVNINVNDTAKLSNETVANKSGSNTMGLTNLFGLESTLGRILPKGFAPATALNTASQFKNDGLGTVNRSEAVSLTVAAVVTSVLPNGNLVIQGRQEIMINSELRELTVAGIVRPEDISSNNTIQHTQIAEARVTYGGKGAMSRVQDTPAGSALMQKFSPF